MPDLPGRAFADDVIVSLDCPSRAAADDLTSALGDAATSYKIGIQTLVTAGPELARDLVAGGKRVFLDLKLHEVPNSVACAVTAAGHLGASMVTVHASGGADVLAAAVRAASPFPELQVLALTVITSLDDGDLASIGIGGSVGAQVERLAQLARDAGCDGVVCSVHEAAVMRSMWGPEALVVTPGIGLGTGHEMRGGGDQVRVGTPEDARNAGASHVVLGRSLTCAPDPRAAHGAARLRFLG